MIAAQPHCIVIGAGIVGASCAWHLRQRGAAVTVIDSEQPGQATSFGNAGCISTSSITPFSYPGAIWKVPGWLLDPLGPMRIQWSHVFALAPWLWRFWRAGQAERVQQIAAAQYALMESVTADYDEILAATGAEGLRRCDGMILLYDGKQSWADDAWRYAIRDQFGLPWQRLTAAEVAAMEPAVRLGDGIAVLDPVWQHLLAPGDVTRTIAEATFSNGATWLNDRVTRVESLPAGVMAETQSGRQVTGDYLVLASGVWTNRLLNQLGHHVPLTPKRGYHTMLASPSAQVNRPLMAVNEYIVMTPMRHGLRVAGTAEFAAIDAAPDYRRADALLTHARRYLPDLAAESTTRWMGQRPMTPDSMPVLGPVPGLPRVLCAFGHGHYGLTQGPTTGRIVADLVFGQAPHVDLSPFSLSRF